MAVTLELSRELSKVVGQSKVSLEAKSLTELALKLAEAHPEIRKYVINPDGSVRKSLCFYMDDEVLGRDDVIPDGAFVSMLFSVQGG